MKNLLNNKVRETHRDINIIWDNITAFFIRNMIICPPGTYNNEDHYPFSEFLFTISSPNNIDSLKVQELIERYSEYKIYNGGN